MGSPRISAPSLLEWCFLNAVCYHRTQILNLLHQQLIVTDVVLRAQILTKEGGNDGECMCIGVI